MTAPLPPDPAVSRVADWLAKEYGELLDRDPPGYWEFQARELLDVVADTTAGEAETLPPVGLRPRWLADEMRAAEITAAVGRYEAAGRDVPAEWRDELAALLTRAARSGGAQDDGLRARVEWLADALDRESAEMQAWNRKGRTGRLDAEITRVKSQSAARLRRALAGPDDARQDGAR